MEFASHLFLDEAEPGEGGVVPDLVAVGGGEGGDDLLDVDVEAVGLRHEMILVVDVG